MKADATAPTTKYAVTKISAIVILTPFAFMVRCTNERQKEVRTPINVHMIHVVMQNKHNKVARLLNNFERAKQAKYLDNETLFEILQPYTLQSSCQTFYPYLLFWVSRFSMLAHPYSGPKKIQFP